MEKRIASVGGLLAIGLMLVTLASASGVATMFQEKLEFEANVSDGNLVLTLIQEDDGKEIQETLVPLALTGKEAGIITLEGSSDGIHVKISTWEMPEEMPQPDMPEGGLFGIAEKDERVQELIAGLTAGEDYNVVAEGVFTTQEGTIGHLLLEVQGKYYDIIIDMNNEIVESVKEGPSFLILLEG